MISNVLSIQVSYLEGASVVVKSKVLRAWVEPATEAKIADVINIEINVMKH